MKTLLLAMAVAMSLASAAEPVTTKTSAKWIDAITIAPVGALKTANLDGASQWGAGVDLGYKVNSFVSLHVANLSFEGAGQTMSETKKPGTFVTTGEDSWGGLLVDETDVYAKAKLTRFSNDTVTLYALGGGQYEWNERAFGIGVGGGVSLNFSQHVSVAVDYTVRAWFSELEHGQSADSLLRGLVNISF